MPCSYKNFLLITHLKACLFLKDLTVRKGRVGGGRVGVFDTRPEAIEASKRMRVELKLAGHIDYVHPNKRTDTRKENYNADEHDKEFMRAKKLANPIDYKKQGVYPQKRSENGGT